MDDVRACRGDDALQFARLQLAQSMIVAARPIPESSAHQSRLDHRSAARTPMLNSQLGIQVDAPRMSGPTSGRIRTTRANNLRRYRRMNSILDQSSPSVASASRACAALEYSEGSHEANARQCNSGRRVASRTG